LLNNKIYNFNKKVEIPVTIGLFGLSTYGFIYLGQKPTLDSNQVISLNQNDINNFDRKVFSQSYPAPSSIYTISDVGLWTTFFAPALLFLDREIRKDWLNVTLLYLETQAINQNLYLWGGPAFTKRVRPIIYIDEVSMEYKLSDDGTTDSFFSGHVSISAGASFFMAKVLSDYHPELGAKKWLLFAGALVPPVFVGYCRYRGYMHFPTDNLVGLTIGAATGILVPHLHKVSNKKIKNLSIVPFTGNITGIALSLEL
jgi:membrane-associated phospholipid phosphatase